MVTLDTVSWKKLMHQLQRHEGCITNKEGQHICYRCPAGKLTIGYGHNLDAGPIKGIDHHSVLNNEQADALLYKDMEVAYEHVLKAIPWIDTIDPVRAAVLINMAFNMGIAGLLKFKQTLAVIEQGDYLKASHEMLQSTWAHQVGRRADELSEQMKTGQWC